jgi:hypothetical protein
MTDSLVARAHSVERHHCDDGAYVILGEQDLETVRFQTILADAAAFANERDSERFKNFSVN